MSRDDLTSLFRAWPEVPGSFPVRIIRAEDGRRLLQRRVEMGVLQMETTGRPDGARPQGFDSILHAFRTRWQGTEPDPSIEDLADALAEARQFLHRAMAFAAVGEIDAAGRDAAHAGAVLAVGAALRGAADARVATMLAAQAILLRVRAEVAAVLPSVGSNGAIAAIDQGLGELTALLGADDLGGNGIAAGAPGILRALRASLVLKLPSSQREELRRRMTDAIRAENFELAAILRDELRLLGG